MTNFMSNQTFILIILGTMLVTYIPRMLPLVFLSKVTLPKKVEKFLDYIPIAILGAILFQSVLYKEGNLNISFSNEFLIAGIITVIVAKFVKRIEIIVVVGILTVFTLRLF